VGTGTEKPVRDSAFLNQMLIGRDMEMVAIQISNVNCSLY
jgi:hypothetical protein